MHPATITRPANPTTYTVGTGLACLVWVSKAIVWAAIFHSNHPFCRRKYASEGSVTAIRLA